MKSTKVLAIAIGMTFMVFSAKQAAAQWYVGGSLGYHSESSTDLLHFSPEAGYSFNPHWTVGLSTSLQNLTYQVRVLDPNDANHYITEKRSNFYCFLNPYVRYTFLRMDRLSFFADAAASFDANHGFSVYYLGLRPGMSYQLTDHFTAVAHLGFIGSDHQTFKAEAGLDNLEFSLYYLFGKKSQ